MGSADHAGRLTTHWAPPPPASSGGSPRVPLSLLHVSKLWVCQFLAACGPMNPCEAEWCALIGRCLLSWIEECVSFLLKCVFSFNPPAYKYSPTLVEIISNKPLPLG